MNKRLIIQLFGKVLLICGLFMLLPLIVAIQYRDGCIMAFLTGTALTGGIGALCAFAVHPEDLRMRPREGFAVVTLSWLILSLLGALPLYMSGTYKGYADCVFEIVSGFTTTGATVSSNVDMLPRSITFWRSLTHWMGGVGILVLTMALIPQMGSRSLHILRAESTGPNPDKIVPRTSKSAKALYTVYITLSVAELIALKICGLDFFDAFVHMFSSAGTGGFSNYSDSVAHFNSRAVENIIAVSMLLFSLNFTLYYRLIHKEWSAFTKNTETKVFFIIVAVSVLLISLDTRSLYSNMSEAFHHGFFQVSSIISTTGFASVDFDKWPLFSQLILICLMFIGGCAGSTAGGLKVLRIVLLCKCACREVHNLAHPRSVRVVKLDGHAVDEELVSSVAVYFFVYILITGAAVALVSLNGMPFKETVTSVIACITNTGPGLGFAGPAGSFYPFSNFSKIILSMCMLIGRLDIYPLLIFFSGDTWRKS